MHRSYFFVRHGRAVYQERGFRPEAWPRGTDWPLAPRGHEQAHAVSRFLLAAGTERVVSSALLRARETATRIAQRGALPYADAWPELDELKVRQLRSRLRAPRAPRDGEADEVARAEVLDGPTRRGRPRAVRMTIQSPEWWDGWFMARAMRRHLRGEDPAGWAVAPIAERVREVLARLDGMREPRVAVVGHGFWILMAAMTLDGPRRLRWIDNCSVTRVDADGRGSYRLVSFATPIVRA